MAEAPPDLQEAINTLFIASFASHRWMSRRGRSHWVDSEGWQDSMAGPLSSIARTGGCAYVYSRNDRYFASVSDPTRLRSRLLEWHAGLAAGVERFAPATSDEAADLVFMRSVVGRMLALVEQACAVEQARRQASKHA